MTDTPVGPGGAAAVRPADSEAVLASAWTLKQQCYATWTSEPQQAAQAADALQQLARTWPALEPVQALADWCAGVVCLNQGRMAEAVARLDAAAARWQRLGRPLEAAQTQVPKVMALSMLVVFLVLAALYESWSIPLSVMLVVPLGLLGAVAAVLLRGMPNDVFFKVGMITVIGLSAKNAILIVEVARQLRGQGKPLVDAVLMASRLRLRPILMTSLAFGLGVVPLSPAFLYARTPADLATLAPDSTGELADLQGRMNEIVGIAESQAPVLIMRFVHDPQEAPRSLRRPLSEVVISSENTVGTN